MITEFKLNVADVWRWKDQPQVLRAMLEQSYSQICIAYSVHDTNSATQDAEALYIGETLFDACESIFPIHVYQPGITPTDHIVFILRIKNLDIFLERLRALGEMFDASASQATAQTRRGVANRLIGENDTLKTHFPDLQQRLREHRHA